MARFYPLVGVGIWPQIQGDIPACAPITGLYLYSCPIEDGKCVVVLDEAFTLDMVGRCSRSCFAR